MRKIVLWIVIILLVNSVNAQTELWGMTPSGGQHGYGTIFKTDASGNNENAQYSFYRDAGQRPTYTKLLQASNGKLYGMTKDVLGVLFEYDPITEIYKIKVKFYSAIGSNPWGSLIQANDGKLYGMTYSGGLNNQGVLFQYDPITDIYVKKIDFSATTGYNPYGSLMQANDGNLYGMTSAGGINNLGTLFQYDFVTNTFIKKMDFSTSNGSVPRGSLIQANDGMLYGITSLGGANGGGTLFQYDISTYTYTKKVDFVAINGVSPYGSLLQASDGQMYGMTYSGGANSFGTLFQYNPTTSILTKKLDFNGTTNGKLPMGSLMQANDGMLYGMTNRGGTGGFGVIFQYNPNTSTYLKKMDFGGALNGGGPQGTLMQSTDGKLYGLTYEGGGPSDHGTLFQYDISTNAYIKKNNFDEATDGDAPFGSVMQANNNKLYGVTTSGGVNANGVLFQFDPVTKLYEKKLEFYYSTTGNGQKGSLIQASDGKLYGMTYNQGPVGGGVLFQYDPVTNILTNKVNFDGTLKGSQPCSKLLEASDGKLYGMTSLGGVNNKGVLFQYDPATNTYIKKIDFAGVSNGERPFGALIQASDGKLYGTTVDGGTFTKGVLFQYDITTNVLTKKVDFNATSNGIYPQCTLVQGNDGKIYGTTNQGGANSVGVFFQYDFINNIYIKKIDFISSVYGGNPVGVLLNASNGKIYGITPNGGLNNYGTIYQYDPATSSLNVTKNFDGANGSSAEVSAALIEINFVINTSAVSTTNCIGSNILVPYMFSGTYNSGNVFTAQLSDANGSFSSPVNIGSITSVSAGTINAIIPPTTMVGSNYRIRVVSNNPVVIGSDNGSNITINAMPIPTITLNSGSICSGTNFTLTPSGASTYTYLNGGALVSPTVSTTYTVLGTDFNGCLGSATSSVSVNPIPNITVNSGIICSNQSFTLTPNGANSYSYSSGSSIVTPSTNITYTVTGTDINGCSNVAISSVSVNPIPLITLNSGTICAGVSFTINASGANTYSYSGGSSIISPTTTTNYTVIGIDANGCVNNAISSVVVNTNPVISSIGTSNEISCLSAIAQCTLNAGGVIQWTGPGIVSGSNTTSASVNSPGIYSVSVTGTNSCTSSATVAVSSNTTTPAFSLVPSVLTVCAGSSVSILANPTGTNSISYLWDNAVTSQSISVSPTVTTVYTATVTDNTNGCYSSQTTTVNVNALPTLTVTGTNTVCLGTSTGFILTGATTYTWNTGQTTSSISINPTVTTTYTVLGMDMNGCINSQTVNITVNSTCADVWPGDANSDGTADNLDALELGLHFTQIGAPRASASNNWQSYFANNWTGTITNGSNLNHSDCNGDGTIDDNDTLAIFNNYGLSHAFKPAQTNTVNPQLSIVPDQSMVVKGNWGTASVYLGDAISQINNINGVAFTVDFDNTLIEPNSIWLEYQNSFIDASQNLYFRKLDFANSKLFTASTHTVNNNVSGFGKIATLHYQVLSSLATDQVLNIGLSQANQSSANGSITPLSTGTGTLMAIGASVGIKESLISGGMLISPNPTNGLLNISFNTIPQNTKIELYNSIGALILSETMNNKINTINMSELSSGIYFMKVLESNKVVAVKKVVRE